MLHAIAERQQEAGRTVPSVRAARVGDVAPAVEAGRVAGVDSAEAVTRVRRLLRRAEVAAPAVVTRTKKLLAVSG